MSSVDGYTAIYNKIPETDEKYQKMALANLEQTPIRAILLATKILNKEMRHETIKYLVRVVTVLHPRILDVVCGAIVEKDLCQTRKCHPRKSSYDFTKKDFRVAAKALDPQTDPKEALYLSELIIT